MENTKHKSTSIVRFIIVNILAIIIFFIKLPIGGTSILPIDWICNLTKGLLSNFNLVLALLASAAVIYTLVKTKFWTGAPFSIFLNSVSILIIVMFLLDALNIMPAFFVNDGTYQKALDTMVPFTVGIWTIMFFLPLLVNYGLPEAVAVFARPLTRKLFKLPGVSAVTIVSAFMGNFTAGHMQTDMLYREGKLTLREAAIIATGFCTSSVGLIMSICAAGGEMGRFTTLFILIFLSTLMITAITAHIYPLNQYPDSTFENVALEREESKKGNVFSNALEAGLDVCDQSKPVLMNCITFGIKALMPTMTNLLVSGVGCMFVFSLINKYTPVFTWIGLLFYPLLKLVGFSNIGLVAGAIGINAVDNVTSQITLATAASAGKMTVLFGCGFGIMTVIFFGAYIASLYSTKISIKFKDLLILWAERTALTIVIWGFVARILSNL